MNFISTLEGRVDGPVSVALVGPGVYGSHLAHQIEETPGVVPVVLADQELRKATETFRRAGVPGGDVTVAETADGVQDALRAGARVTTTDGALAAGADVDVVGPVLEDEGTAVHEAF
jgi:predicted homoserine dehydrogenase-like protein